MLFVGQVIRGKGLDLLLSAASKLRGEWTLDVVGEGRHVAEDAQAAGRAAGNRRARELCGLGAA